MNDDASWSRAVASGTRVVKIPVASSAASPPSTTMTVILYKMTSATAGTEIGRGSVTFTPTGSLVLQTVNITGVAAQTYAYGETLAIEVYLAAAGASGGNTLTVGIGVVGAAATSRCRPQ